MIQSDQIYIPIPKTRNTHPKVEIAGVDVTARVINSKWIKPVTKGIGIFNLTLSNSNGQFSGDYNPGDVVKFYADNLDATTLQFWGRIDYTKDDISEKGQFLNIDGRHRAFLLNEFFVCHTATNIATSEILKDIINKLPSSYGFTYNNIQDDTSTMSVEWNYKPFWTCVVELCNKAGFDCYVDNDLDFHYFEENSIANPSDAIVEGDNFIKASDLGTNDYYEKTRVVANGQDSSGLPIIYTAISSTESDEVREVFINDASANTYDKVKDIANAKLAELSNRNVQEKIESFGLETVNPGDNIWIIVPRQKIAGQYKLSQITHKFGMKIGGWKTECITEEQETGISSIIQNLDQATNQIKSPTQIQNVYKLNYTYHFDFNTDIGGHTNTEIIQGVLKTDGSATGTWISPIRSLDEGPEAFQLRMAGELQTAIVVYMSVDGGTTWVRVSQLNQDIEFKIRGKDLRIKVVFSSASARLYGLSLLYS